MTPEDDVTRRTWLAAERTWLAWWRTALGASIAALAVGRVVPDLAGGAHWPYAALGAAYAVLSIAVFALGIRRWRAIGRALNEGRFAPPDPWAIGALTVAGAVLAVATLVLVVVEP